MIDSLDDLDPLERDALSGRPSERAAAAVALAHHARQARIDAAVSRTEILRLADERDSKQQEVNRLRVDVDLRNGWLAELRAEVQRLTEERDETRGLLANANAIIAQEADRTDEIQAALTRAEEENGRMRAVTEAALLWWRSKRPPRWDEGTHLNIHGVNTAGAAEQTLSSVVAAHVRAALNPKGEGA